MIEKDDFNAWLQHPVTQEVRKMLAARRERLRQEWEHSDPTAYTQESFVLASVGNIGWCRGLAFAETLDYETYAMELDDEEPIGVGPERSSSAD